MNQIPGFRSSNTGSSYLGGLSSQNAMDRAGLASDVADSKYKVVMAKENAQSYLKQAEQQAGAARREGLMSGLGSVASGAMGAFGGSIGGGAKDLRGVAERGYSGLKFDPNSIKGVGSISGSTDWAGLDTQNFGSFFSR